MKSFTEPQKNGLIEISANSDRGLKFSGIREYYNRPDVLKLSLKYENGLLNGLSRVFRPDGNVLFEHYYEYGELKYSFRYNYVNNVLISKFKIEKNNITIV